MVLVLATHGSRSGQRTLRCWTDPAVARGLQFATIRIPKSRTATPMTIAAGRRRPPGVADPPASRAAGQKVRFEGRDLLPRAFRPPQAPFNPVPDSSSGPRRPDGAREFPAQPRSECVPVGGADGVGIHTPDPNGRLLSVDIGPECGILKILLSFFAFARRPRTRREVADRFVRIARRPIKPGTHAGSPCSEAIPLGHMFLDGAMADPRVLQQSRHATAGITLAQYERQPPGTNGGKTVDRGNRTTRIDGRRVELLVAAGALC